MSIRKLAGVVAAMVLFTGLAVGWYVESLRRPVQAAEQPTAEADALRRLGGCSDDVRTSTVAGTHRTAAAKRTSGLFGSSGSDKSTKITLRKGTPCIGGISNGLRALAAEREGVEGSTASSSVEG